MQGRQDLAEENTINVSTSANSAAVASLDKDAPTDFSRYWKILSNDIEAIEGVVECFWLSRGA
jgi:hypothetical protein